MNFIKIYMNTQKKEGKMCNALFLGDVFTKNKDQIGMSTDVIYDDNKSVFYKMLRRISLYFNSSFFYKFSMHDMNKYDVVIIYECIYPLKVIKKIRERNKQCKIIYWCSNIIDSNKDYCFLPNKKNVLELLSVKNREKFNYYICTFDENDALKYNLLKNNQFIPYYETIITDNCYDLSFIGTCKGRDSLLSKIANICDENNLNYNFAFVGKDVIQDERIKILHHKLSYKEFLTEELSAKAVLEVVQEGQVGITWRTLEALIYNRKLITNNKNIIEYDFYNSSNIFIIGVDDINKLSQFINSNSIQINNSIIEKYKLNSWAKKMIKLGDKR